MNFKKFGVLLLTLMLVTVLAVGCGNKDNQQKGEVPNGDDEFLVGFIYIGEPGDAGFTYAHDIGRQYMVDKLPNVKTKVFENVQEGSADVERSLEQLAQDGCKVIIANSFGFGDAVHEVAKRYPDKVFLHCSGLETADNVGTYFGRIYQARYLSGMVAGAMTENNNIGYVAAYTIPEVVRGINAFTLGAQAVNPDVKVTVVKTNTWYDPNVEKQAAISLLEAGCDVIAQHQDTPSAQIAAEEAGKYSIGYNSDMSKFAPNAHLTSPVWNWGPYYVKVVQEVMNGTWKSTAYWGGLDEDIIDLAPISDQVPADIVAQVEAKKQAMANKEWDVFYGPIADQAGNIKVKEGGKMTDEEMLSFNWFVKGVEGKVD